MYRFLLIAIVSLIICPAYGDSAQFDPAQIKAGLQAIEESLPSLKANLDMLKVRGQDVSYPMAGYTVLENFVGYAKEDVDKGEIKRAEDQLSDMERIKQELDQELSEALAGKHKFPAVPRWTADTRPVVKSSSFIAPTTTPGKSGRETRPVFFNGYGHFAQVRADIEKWPNYGINIIQFEIGPWEIFPEEGKVDKTPIQNLLKDLDRAQKAGVAVNLLISPHYFPGWMLDKYPELRKNRQGIFPMCLHAPETTELLKKFISALISPVKDHPALHSICISNEPTNIEEPCKYASAEFHAWLKNRHGDIATLNDCWGTSYASFDDIVLPNLLAEGAQQPMGRWADFVRWNQEFFANWHEMLADAIHAVAPNVPVHVKVQSFTLNRSTELKCGNDAYLYGRISDINGNDSVNWYCFGDGEFAQSWTTNAHGEDLQRSVKDAPVFNSENHLIPDRETRYIPDKHVRTALWQQAIHGQSASTIWVWQRSFDPKDDLYGSIMTRPGCARAVGIVNFDLNRAAREVTALQQAPAQILVLHDTSSMVYDQSDYDTCFFKTYNALNFCGVKVGFVTERQLEDGLVPDAPVLCIPNARHLSNAAFRTLKKYKGHLVMFGVDTLAYDEYNKPRSERLSGDMIPFSVNNTSKNDIYTAMLPKLLAWNVVPKVAVVDENGDPVRGVERREADTAGEILLNVCNYLNTPIGIKLRSKEGYVKAVDVLTGQSVSGVIMLQPLDFRLLRIKK